VFLLPRVFHHLLQLVSLLLPELEQLVLLREEFPLALEELVLDQLVAQLVVLEEYLAWLALVAANRLVDPLLFYLPLGHYQNYWQRHD